ncbi:hypothetical protein KA529_02685 [Candidatus Saccharibacteria bacterium]|nr:hypothetical protein [Candidatus Saccharibacteria bacterium]
MQRVIKYLKKCFNSLYAQKGKIGFAIVLSTFVLAIATPLTSWTYKAISRPDQAITTEVCTTLKKPKISYKTESGKTLNVDTKLLNKGYLLIKNSGKKELSNVGITISFDSRQKMSILYVDTYGSSAGIIQNIDKPELDLKDNQITFNLNYINSDEQIVMDFGLDRPANAYVEIRGAGLTKQQDTIPGCENFKDLQAVQNSKLFGAKGLTYIGPECKKNEDGSLVCTLTSTSDTFSVPGDVMPGSVLQEDAQIDRDKDPLAD